ncbi:RBR-type E3 ubiquitin transferase [Salvia divinorum]|uniref:RBR-type E3 ubiquitin transferase n=1 Tax=Salvia divinorum TaxID=28513 RepID=A0ABD1FTV4_SALDI
MRAEANRFRSTHFMLLRAYISTSINDGPGCLVLRCPNPSCGAAAGQDMIDKLASHEDKEKYRRYLLRSYVEDSCKIKWCPAPGCDSAVEYVVGSGSYDVTCSCSYSFCWNCAEEAHRPVDCETVAKWVLKNSAESENMNWILANSKPCPKCKRPIEKNQGCMHMHALHHASLSFVGCVLVNGQSMVRELEVSMHATVMKQQSKRECMMNQKGGGRWPRTPWKDTLIIMSDGHPTNRQGKRHWRICIKCKVYILRSLVKFIPSLSVTIEVHYCLDKRVLKWTYAYGYYLPEVEHTKKQFFEYLQAEAGLERLHQCAEKELMNYLNSKGPSKDFNDFRTKLAGLTSVTRNYFENLVRALENGLSDVDSQAKCTDDSGSWACDKCTYMNSRSAAACHVCNHRN